MTSQARGKNKTADPTVLSDLLDANRACLVQVQKGKKDGWKGAEAAIKKAGVSWAKLLNDSSFPEAVAADLTNFFATELENYNVPHKPLYHLCLTALAALQKLVFEPQSTVYDESLMTKKDTELSAAERASKETLCRTGALIAAIADRMSLLDNQYISASSQASQNGASISLPVETALSNAYCCVTAKGIDQIIGLLTDLRGGQLDKGVASDELARLLICLLRVDAGLDGAPLATVISLEQKQALVKLLFASHSAGTSLYLCRCVMYVLSPGDISGSSDSANRQSAFIAICKGLNLPAKYTNAISNAIVKVKRSYAKSGRDFMHMVNVVSARSKDNLPRACPVQAFLVNGVSVVQGDKAKARLKSGDLIVYTDQYRTRMQLYDQDDNEEPAFLLFDRMRKFKRITQGESNNVFTWQSKKSDDSSSYNEISISIEPQYADGFEQAMLRCAPHLKSSRSSLTKNAIPSDGIERALTPSPGRRSQSAGSEEEADEEDNEAANESQLSRREMIAKNRHYVDTPGTVRGEAQDSDNEVEEGVIVPNSGLPADHPDLNPFSPQGSPRASPEHTKNTRVAVRKVASDPPGSDDAPSHVSDSMENSTAQKDNTRKGKKGSTATSASSTSVRDAKKAANTVAVRRSARRTSASDKEAETNDPAQVSQAESLEQTATAPKPPAKGKGKARVSVDPAGPGGDVSSPAAVSDATPSDNKHQVDVTSAQADGIINAIKSSASSIAAVDKGLKTDKDTPASTCPSRAAKNQARASVAKQSAQSHDANSTDEHEDPADAAATAEVAGNIAKISESATPASNKATGKSRKVVLAPKKGAASTEADPTPQATKQAPEPRRSARIRESLTPTKDTEHIAAETEPNDDPARSETVAMPKGKDAARSKRTTAVAKQPLLSGTAADVSTSAIEEEGFALQSGTGAPSKAPQGDSDADSSTTGAAAGGETRCAKTGKRDDGEHENREGSQHDEDEGQGEGGGTDQEQEEAQEAAPAKTKELLQVDKDEKNRQSLVSQPSQQLEMKKETAITRSRTTYGSKAPSKAAAVFGSDDSDLSAAGSEDEAEKAQGAPASKRKPIEIAGRQMKTSSKSQSQPRSNNRNSDRKPAPGPTLGQAIEQGRASTPAAVLRGLPVKDDRAETRYRGNALETASADNTANKPNAKSTKERELVQQLDAEKLHDAEIGGEGSKLKVSVEVCEQTKALSSSLKPKGDTKSKLSQEVERSHDDDDSSVIGKTFEEIEAEELAQKKAAKAKGTVSGSSKSRVGPANRRGETVTDTLASGNAGKSGRHIASVGKARPAAAEKSSSRTKPAHLADNAPLPKPGAKRPDGDDNLNPASVSAQEAVAEDVAVTHVPTDTAEPTEGGARSMPVKPRAGAGDLDRDPPSDQILRAAYEEGREKGVELASSFFDATIDAANGQDPHIQKEREEHARAEKKRAKAVAAAAKAADLAKLAEEAAIQAAAALEAEEEAQMEAEAQAVLDQGVLLDQQAELDNAYLTPLDNTPVQPRRKISDTPVQVIAKQVAVTTVKAGKVGAKEAATAKSKALQDPVAPASSPLFLETRSHDDAGEPMNSSPTLEVAAAIGISWHRKLRRMSRPEGEADVASGSTRNSTKRPLGLVARDSMLLQDSADVDIADVTLVDDSINLTHARPPSRSARPTQPLKSALKGTRFASQVEILQRARLVDAEGGGDNAERTVKPRGTKRKTSDDVSGRVESHEKDYRQVALAVLDEYRDLMSTRINTRLDILNRTATALQARLIIKAGKEVRSISKQGRKLYDHTARAHATHVDKSKDGALQADLGQHNDLFKTAARGLKTHIQKRDADYRALLDLWKL